MVRSLHVLLVVLAVVVAENRVHVGEHGVENSTNVLEFEPGSKVLTMTDHNFEEALTTYDMFAVEFYAPWCAQCKTIAPAYAELAGKLANQNHPITLAKYNTKNEKALAKEVNIDKLPYLIAFIRGDRNGTVFSGQSTIEEMEKWLQEVREANEFVPSSSIVHLKGKKAAKKFEKQHVGVLGFFPKFSGPEYEVFTAAAESHLHRKHVKFALSTGKSSAKYFGVSQKTPSVTLMGEGVDNYERKPLPTKAFEDVASFNDALLDGTTESICDLAERCVLE
jgi:thiol-disulfide isomerase/thioredoxin